MKKSILTLIVCLFIATAQSQSVDKIDDINVQIIEHATFAITWNGKIILFDPSVEKDKLKNVQSPDIIFITDIHGDHFNIATLENLNLSKATLIVPQSVADQLPEKFRRNIHILKNGEDIELAEIKVEAIPMYNLPVAEESFHTKGRGNGYVLTLGSKRVYVSGDTEDIPEMRELKDIDLAFICMNLPYTMTVKQAAEAVLSFKPKIVYPYHYRGQNGKSDISTFKQLVNDRDKSIKVVIRDWYLSK
jgi:L-ascorbate metabolism protein UlaG (beta-lactamase superfamily)